MENQELLKGDEFVNSFKIKLGKQEITCFGITKREMFAGMAMQGMLAKFGTDYQNDVIKASIYMADELIKELKK